MAVYLLVFLEASMEARALDFWIVENAILHNLSIGLEIMWCLTFTVSGCWTC